MVRALENLPAVYARKTPRFIILPTIFPSVKLTIQDFETWLRERGYDLMMGEENFRTYLNLGFSSLLFYNSNLLFSFILDKMGVKTEERVPDRIRFEIAKRIRKISASKDEIEMEL